MAKLAITLKRSPHGWTPQQRKTLRALGLRRREQTVVHEDTPVVRGMVRHVRHAVVVQQHDEAR